MTENQIDEIIRKIYDNTKDTVSEAYVIDSDENPYLEVIFEPMFRDAARFIESYCYDFIITWQSVVKLIGKYNGLNEDRSIIVPFAMRRLGCDGSAFMMSRIIEHKHNIYSYVQDFYRRIYAIEIHRTLDDRYKDGTFVTKITLKDIHGSVPYICKHEMDVM